MIYNYKGYKIEASSRKEALAKIMGTTNKSQLLGSMCNQLGFSLPFQIKTNTSKEEEKKEFLSNAVKDKDISIDDLLKKTPLINIQKQPLMPMKRWKMNVQSFQKRLGN